MAGNVFELQAARARHAADAERRRLPVQGPRAFDVDDAGFFFGRERLVAELVARLTGAPLTGHRRRRRAAASRPRCAPGCCRAGGRRAAGQRALADRRAAPGRAPAGELERVRHGGDGRPARRRPVRGALHGLRDEGERAAFADALVAPRSAPARNRAPRRPGRLLRALRDYPELARLLGASHVLVGPMRRDELRRAIELPAQRAGLKLEPELADALLADVEGRPGALPLLSTALLELWQQRDGRRLRMSAYERAGGVRGAVARLAERAYERLDAERRASARRILLRLRGEGAPRRRVAARRARRRGRAEVLAVLADERLLTIGDGEVELAHEALLREWPRLRGWLDDDAQGRRLHLHLREAARDWADAGRDPASSTAARGWPRCSTGDRSRRRAQRGRARIHRRQPRGEPASQRRLERALAGLGALLVLAVAAGAIALDQRGSARARGDRGRGTAPRRARPRRGRPRRLAAARPPGRGARRLAADAREPAGRAAQAPGRDRRAARRRRSRWSASTSAPMSARWRSSTTTARSASWTGAPGGRSAAASSPGTSASSTPWSARRTCGSALTAHGSPSAAASRWSWTCARVASCPAAASARPVRLRVALRAGRAHAPRRVRFPFVTTLAPALRRAHRPAVGTRHGGQLGLVTMMLTRDGRRVVTTGSATDDLSATPAPCGSSGAGPWARSWRP